MSLAEVTGREERDLIPITASSSTPLLFCADDTASAAGIALQDEPFYPAKFIGARKRVGLGRSFLSFSLQPLFRVLVLRRPLFGIKSSTFSYRVVGRLDSTRETNERFSIDSKISEEWQTPLRTAKKTSRSSSGEGFLSTWLRQQVPFSPFEQIS